MEVRTVLVLCTGNSCRSQMAEGFINSDFVGHWKASSAGSHPTGFVHPLAIQAMQEVGCPVSSHVTKSVKTLHDQTFDLVITVCDGAREVCPRFPGARVVHLPFADPAGGDIHAFRSTRDEIRRALKNLFDGADTARSVADLVPATTRSGSKKVIIFGAGPAGVEAALYGSNVMGYEPIIYECESSVGGSMLQWGFVKLFTPWKQNVSAEGLEFLSRLGKHLPDPEVCPTGSEFVESYLRPIAEGLLLKHGSSAVQCGVKVVSVSRQGMLKVDAPAVARQDAPFRVLLVRDGEEFEDTAYAVIDASGVYKSPCWLGDGGIPALGERTCKSDSIVRHIPDVLSKDRADYAQRRVLLVGAGFSAATALRSLRALVQLEPATQVTWARRSTTLQPFPTFKADPLADRAELAADGNRVAMGLTNWCRVMSGVYVHAVAHSLDGEMRVELHGADNASHCVVVDRIIALVGYRPELDITRELHVHHCYSSEGLMKLASSMLVAARAGADARDCLQQTSHGTDCLRNPEPRFFVVGSKSYGRSNNYLLSVGIEQVKSVFQLLSEPG